MLGVELFEPLVHAPPKRGRHDGFAGLGLRHFLALADLGGPEQLQVGFVWTKVTGRQERSALAQLVLGAALNQVIDGVRQPDRGSGQPDVDAAGGDVALQYGQGLARGVQVQLVDQDAIGGVQLPLGHGLFGSADLGQLGLKGADLQGQLGLPFVAAGADAVLQAEAGEDLRELSHHQPAVRVERHLQAVVQPVFDELAGDVRLAAARGHGQTDALVSGANRFND